MKQKKKALKHQQQQFATLEFLPSSQITVTHWFFLLPLSPVSVVPSCHPPLFIAISFYVFFSFQAVLHVPDMSRCSHTPRSFKFTPRLIFPPIRATCTATPSKMPTKTMDAPPFKIRQFIFAIKRQFQAICSDLPNGTQRVKQVIL